MIRGRVIDVRVEHVTGERKKATFSLSSGVLAQLDEAIRHGNAPSKNAFVERAVASALREVQREERRRRWEEAMHDPLFRRDLAEVEATFATADAETANAADRAV